MLSAVDHYGNELNVETKRKLMQRCEKAPRFCGRCWKVSGMRDKRSYGQTVWREAGKGVRFRWIFCRYYETDSAGIGKSIFTDERMEKRIAGALRKCGMRVLYTYLFLNGEGKFEVHVTVRSTGKEKGTAKEVVQAVSEAAGRRFVLAHGSPQVVGFRYMTIVCREGPSYYTLSGTAKIGKGCAKISGDNFTLMELPGGKKAAALSDGMGAGETACKESTLVIELLEELLAAGFPEKAAVQMINTTLATGREEIHYSTVDLSVFDLYSGECEIVKAGASSTFIKKKDCVEHLSSTSLPIGVVHHIEIDSVRRKLEDGDFVIMVTDGILDALPVGEQDILLETIIQGSAIVNPKEMAHHILEQVLAWTGREPADDMTVIVVGMWEICDRNTLQARMDSV